MFTHNVYIIDENKRIFFKHDGKCYLFIIIIRARKRGIHMMGKNCDFYRGKTALAPMVRAGRTPLRILALGYGADLVYTEEVVAARLLQCQRIMNVALGTVDYTLEDEVVMRIANDEASKCVLQIGTNSAESAVAVCKKIGNDVAAIDVNMGCPKPFSIHNGMGAALLSQPERVKEILTAITEVSTIPVSCKIRVLNRRDDTLEFAKMVSRCGVSAIGVHGRRREERPTATNRIDEIRDVARCVDVPILANGQSSKISCYEDIDKFRKMTEASGVLLARKALAQPSIFRSSGGTLTTEEEIHNFLQKCCDYDESFTGTKYVLQRILGSAQEFDPKGRATVAASNNLEICRTWSMDSYYLQLRERRATIRDDANGEPLVKKKRFDVIDGINVFTDLTFAPKKLSLFAGSGTPKCVLNSFCDESNIERPQYELFKRSGDGRFEAIISVSGKRFRSTVSQPNKKMAEQVAALAALIGLDQRARLPEKYEDE